MKKVLLSILGCALVGIAIVSLYPSETQAQLGKVYSLIGRRLVVTDSVNFSNNSIKASAFVGDSLVKTIAITGGQTTDKYFAINTGAVGDSATPITNVIAYAGAVAFYRLGYTPAFTKGEASQAFIYFRSK